MKIYALVVTYNRKELLKECLMAIKQQTLIPDKIIVVDNASTDGTADYFSNNGIFTDDIFIYNKLEKNSGGAGGFSYGIKKFYNECDAIWLMDDDTIPDKNTLLGLIDSAKDLNNKFSFLASSVYGPNGVPMNVPQIDLTETSNGVSDWYFNLNEKMVKIKDATFVSLLIKTDAIRKVGFPCDWFFIWGDDTEYTLRLTRYYAPAYLTGKSKVLHKRKIAKQISVVEETNPNRIKMFYYSYRNNLIIANAYYKPFKKFQVMISEFKDLFNILFKSNCYKFLKVSTVFRGMNDYYLSKYDKKKFNNRFKI